MFRIEFWVGIIVGLVLYWGWLRYQAKKAAG